MKIVYNTIIPFEGFLAMNLFGILFVRCKRDKDGNLIKPELSQETITHETIHTKQMREMLYIFFYLWYGIEWLIRLLFTFDCDRAYYGIGFEGEAYGNEKDSDYPEKRKHFSWLRYMFGRKGDGRS